MVCWPQSTGGYHEAHQGRTQAESPYPLLSFLVVEMNVLEQSKTCITVGQAYHSEVIKDNLQHVHAADKRL